MVSGQAPNPITQSDCQFYMDMVPGTIGADGQAFGQGCVYPSPVKTIADQLRAKGLTWRGYMEDMGNSATEPKTCRHPTLNSQDQTQSAKVGDQYAARHNPFVYFHSIIDDSANCNANVVPLDRLPADLASTQSTPNYSFITPNLCDDGHDSPCVDGRPGGLVSSDAFLRAWVPRILASPAFRKDGLLLVTFDEAETGDATACCDEQPGPNTPNPGGDDCGTGRREDRRGGALAVGPAGVDQRAPLQPLRVPAQRGGHLRALASRLRGTGGARRVRPGRLQRRRPRRSPARPAWRARSRSRVAASTAAAV